jgi:hypothetical protein
MPLGLLFTIELLRWECEMGMHDDDEQPVGWRSPLEKFMVIVLSPIIAAGVIGVWTLSISVYRLDERIAVWTKLYEEKFVSLDKSVHELWQYTYTRKIDRP